jgi:SH3-like domain-containing protein
MAETRALTRRIASVAVAGGCLAVAAAVGWSMFGKRSDSLASAPPAAEITASIDRAESKTLGPSGFPIPRFVSLKAEKVNVRRGPSSDHPVAWVFQRKGLPVEIVAEFDTWRRVRDSDGEEGWILQNMLSGKRTAMMAPWKQGQTIPLYDAPGKAGALVAQVGAGVVADVSNCTGDWCEVTAGGYDGWVEQTQLWGVYPGEPVD